jgi:hypothetical protein
MMPKKSFLNSPTTEEDETSVATGDEALEGVEDTVHVDEGAISRGARRWFASMRNSQLSRNTEVWNYVQSQLPELSKFIEEETKS